MADRLDVITHLRPLVRHTRTWPPNLALLRPGQASPRVVFLPSEHNTGSARLRIYNIAKALRPMGWRTLVLHPSITLCQRRRLIARARPDILVMQGARHPLNRPEYYPKLPIAYDLDDADFHLPHLAEPIGDAMPQVAAVIAGSRYIAEWCRAAGARRTQVVWTSTGVSSLPRQPHQERPPVVAWAQTRPSTYLREADLVRNVITKLASSHSGLTLRLYDKLPEDDPTFASSFGAPGLKVEWLPRANYKTFLASLNDVALGLAPLCPETPFSRGKSFGKLLAYLDRDVPVIASNTGEPSIAFRPDTAVLSNRTDAWVAEATRLLSDPTARIMMAAQARHLLETQLSLGAAAQRTHRLLREIIQTNADGRSAPKTA